MRDTQKYPHETHYYIYCWNGDENFIYYISYNTKSKALTEKKYFSQQGQKTFASPKPQVYFLSNEQWKILTDNIYLL